MTKIRQLTLDQLAPVMAGGAQGQPYSYEVPTCDGSIMPVTVHADCSTTTEVVGADNSYTRWDVPADAQGREGTGYGSFAEGEVTVIRYADGTQVIEDDRTNGTHGVE